jgi:uncharacterized membrane protein
MGKGYGDLIFGVINGDPLSIGFFTSIMVAIFISLVSYTSYFKNRFPKLHMFLNKGSNNK